jgi:capsular polysaccharide biosynthesis protein
MKNTIKRLISLYPRPWRSRYENEFNALLDDVSPTWGTFFNVFGGAMKMQFKTGRSWKIVAACALAGVIAGIVLTWTIPHRYVSTAILEMGDIGDVQLNAEKQKILTRASLTQLIVEADLYRDLRETTPIEDIVLQLKTQDIRIVPVKTQDVGFVPAGGQRYAVSVGASDAGRAQKAAQILAADFLNAKVGTLVDPASLPLVPNSPRLSRNIVMGLIAGVVLGSLFALFAGLKVWKLAAGLGVAGAIAGAAIGYALPERYASTAVLRFTGASAGMSQLAAAVTSDASLKRVVERFKLYPGEAGAERTLREHLHIEPVVGVGQAIVVRFDDRDRFVAQKVVGDVVSLLLEESIRGAARREPDVSMTVELLDPASLPIHPYSPKREIVSAGGLFVGLVCAVLLGIRRNYKTPLPAVAAR